MTQALELYDGTELETGDTIVMTLAGKGETQAMDIVEVPNQYEADLELNGDWVGVIGVNPMHLGAEMDRVGELTLNHGDVHENVASVEVR